MPNDPGTRANLVGLGTNVLLAVAKFVVGVLAGSQALVADGFNSAGDIFATTVAYFGYQLAKVPPDENHHYGHGNAESIAGFVVGTVLLATGLYITLDGVLSLVAGKTDPPGLLAAWVAIGTAVVKEALYRYTVRVGTKLNSPALLASARDHRADVVAAFAVLGGVLAARFSAPWLDPLAAMLIGLYIAAMAIEPIRSNLGILMDEAPPELREKIRAVARADTDVRDATEIRVHPLGSYYVVDLEIYLDGSLSLEESHTIAHRVADRVKAEIEHVHDVKVHVNPSG